MPLPLCALQNFCNIDDFPQTFNLCERTLIRFRIRILS
ncbi:hypothetical protein LEP1GSC061_4222 [Leptospira wolffii serovar Khorat str. Khorat-H2]|nr:hypothetical protein LEP1GSC061_4222 [Leptospira wolffii serovar Khorat str. Khorat-H2]